MNDNKTLLALRDNMFKSCKEQGKEYLRIKKEYGYSSPKTCRAYAVYYLLFSIICAAGLDKEYDEYCKENE